MATCPSCQAQIEIGSEFYGGLFSCPNCRAVYFIGFDGTPESASSSSKPPVEYTPQPDPQEPPPPQILPQISQGLEYQPVNQESLFQGDAPQGEAYNMPLQADATSSGFAPLQDVIDFANSDTTASLATFAVTISGLDSVQNIQVFKEVLSDSKLQISFEPLKPRIKNGKLRMEKLTAAQAAVIAFRLRPYPLIMKWEQSLI